MNRGGDWIRFIETSRPTSVAPPLRSRSPTCVPPAPSRPLARRRPRPKQPPPPRIERRLRRAAQTPLKPPRLRMPRGLPRAASLRFGSFWESCLSPPSPRASSCGTSGESGRRGLPCRRWARRTWSTCPAARGNEQSPPRPSRPPQNPRRQGPRQKEPALRSPTNREARFRPKK